MDKRIIGGQKRIGETNQNRYGSVMKIVEYNNATDILVEFDNNYQVRTNYNHFKKGDIGNPYDKSVRGMGYLGEGNYVTKVNGVKTKEYLCWTSILSRCYNPELHKTRSSYEDCLMCEEWLNFQNFSEWFNRNYYTVGEFKMEIDKDILVKGNKIYSSETCIFVPQFINSLFTKSNKTRGQYPIGVTFNKSQQKFIAQINIESVKKQVGIFDNELDAFYTYKKAKEDYIKSVAEKYKDQIPEKLYLAMLKYEVEIDD